MWLKKAILVKICSDVSVCHIPAFELHQSTKYATNEEGKNSTAPNPST